MNDLGFEFRHVQENFQTSSGAHQPPIQLVLGVQHSFGMNPHNADNLPLLAEVKNRWCCTMYRNSIAHFIPELKLLNLV